MVDSALLDLTDRTLLDKGNWKVVLQSLKPGAHLLVVSQVSDHSRNTVNLEDAGFEIRDTVSWVFSDSERGEQPGLMLITVARKNLDGNVAENVTKWGTGGINIDDCRIGSEVRFNPPTHKSSTVAMGSFSMCNGKGSTVEGRWPANLIHSGDDSVVELFPSPHGAGEKRSGGLSTQSQEGGLFGMGEHEGNGMRYGDSGSAARFFYSPPQNHKGPYMGLLRYLCRLVTPPNGTILALSGNSKVKAAAIVEGFKTTELKNE